MTTPAPYSQPDTRRTFAVWAVLLIWVVALAAPCVHCIAQGVAAPAAPRPAAPQLSAAEEAMLAGMPADCPLHKAMAPAASEREPGGPCDQPADCCLERGGLPAAEEEVLPAPAAPAAATFPPVATLAVFAPPAPLAAAGEPRFERSHAPPAFSLPLRN